jgi:aspartate kinase
MLRVCKFGGSSVADTDKIKNVANVILTTKKQYEQEKKEKEKIVIVLSAMRGETDKLLKMAENMAEDGDYKSPSKKEVDLLVSTGEMKTCSLLSIYLNSIGTKAIAFSANEVRILTDNVHNNAKIEEIETKQITKYLNKDYIVIISGFAGVSKDEFKTTTLGRGGSDLSGVAIAGALNANVCEIYTDVDGIYTADPRVVTKAKMIKEISYDEMLELASSGAKVLQSRSVELAKKCNINLVSRNTFNLQSKGTLITKESNIMEQPIISGITIDNNQVRVGLYDVIDKPGIAALVFEYLYKKNVNVDMIVQTVSKSKLTNLDFTIELKDLEKTKEIMSHFAKEIGKIDFDSDISKVSIVGVGMKSHAGVAYTAFSTMAKANINIRIISTSEIKISMVISRQYGELALNKLHSAYELDDLMENK